MSTRSCDSAAEVVLRKVEKPRGPKAAARWLAVASVCASLLSTAASRADQIVIGETNYPGAKIRTLKDGQVQFVTADGELESVWISDIDLMIVDRGSAFADFNQAEQYLADGEPEKAIVRYRRTLHLSEGFWSDLITLRLLMACDRASRIDQATLHFVQVVRGKWSGPPAAARLIPQTIPSKRTPKTVRAVEHLDAAIAQAPREDERLVLELLRFRILHQTGDHRGGKAAEELAGLTIPKSHCCQRVFAVQLAALEEALSARVEPKALAALDRAIRDCPRSMLPSFLVLKGHTLLRKATTREDVIRASWAFMRVVIHMPDDPRAAEALFGAATSVERIGRRGRAVELLTECLAHQGIGEETRQAADAALKQLASAGEGSG